MSQLSGIWSYTRDGEQNRTELRVYITPGNRRPFDAACVKIDSRGVSSFPKRDTFDTSWGAVQFVREQHGRLTQEGWQLTSESGLALGVDPSHHQIKLAAPVIAVGVQDGCWTYRLPSDGSIHQLRIRVAVNEVNPFAVAGIEFDEHMEPQPIVTRTLRTARQSEALEFLATEARGMDRQGWELISLVGLAEGVNLLATNIRIKLPESHFATQEASWEFKDPATLEQHKVELLVHIDRDMPVEIGHFQRRRGTIRWSAAQPSYAYENLESAMQFIRLKAQELVRAGFQHSGASGLGIGIDPGDENQVVPVRGYAIAA